MARNGDSIERHGILGSMLVTAMAALLLAGCTPMPAGDNENGDGDTPAEQSNTNDGGTSTDDSDTANADGGSDDDSGDVDAIEPADDIDDDGTVTSGSLAAFLGGEPTCGSRTVRTTPSNTHIGTHLTARIDAGPEDSPLAKALFGFALCDNSGFGVEPSEDEPAFTQLQEVDADGEVIASCQLISQDSLALCSQPALGDRLVVIDGCLQYENAEFLAIDPDDFIPEPEVDSPCGENQQVLTRDGIGSLRSDDEPFVCVDISMEQFCLDCGVEDGVWFQELEVVFTATATGDLTDVRVGFTGACEIEEETVDVVRGDSMTVTIGQLVEVEESASPAELGFSEMPIPDVAFPNVELPDVELPDIAIPDQATSGSDE